MSESLDSVEQLNAKVICELMNPEGILQLILVFHFLSQVVEEENRLELERETWASDPNNIDDVVQDASEDFPEENPAAGVDQKIQATADAIAQRCITDKTREGHLW